MLDGFKWLTYLLSVQIRQEERKLLLEEQHTIETGRSPRLQAALLSQPIDSELACRADTVSEAT